MWNDKSSTDQVSSRTILRSPSMAFSAALSCHSGLVICHRVLMKVLTTLLLYWRTFPVHPVPRPLCSSLVSVSMSAPSSRPIPMTISDSVASISMASLLVGSIMDARTAVLVATACPRSAKRHIQCTCYAPQQRSPSSWPKSCLCYRTAGRCMTHKRSPQHVSRLRRHGFSPRSRLQLHRCRRRL